MCWCWGPGGAARLLPRPAATAAGFLEAVLVHCLFGDGKELHAVSFGPGVQGVHFAATNFYVFHSYLLFMQHK